MSTVVRESSGSKIMLFGVCLIVDSMRKSVSLNNISQYVHPQDSLVTGSAGDKDVTAGYAFVDEATVVHLCSSSNYAIAAIRDLKQGVPWMEEEHKLFMLGLQKVGKGDWIGILRNFVKTQTPTQVATMHKSTFSVGAISIVDAADLASSTSPPIRSLHPQQRINTSIKMIPVQDYMAFDTENVADKVMEDLDLNRISMTDSLPLSLPSSGSNIPRKSFHATPSFFSGNIMISVG